MRGNTKHRENLCYLVPDNESSSSGSGGSGGGGRWWQWWQVVVVRRLSDRWQFVVVFTIVVPSLAFELMWGIQPCLYGHCTTRDNRKKMEKL